jgi:hypothetical protein
LKSSVIVFRSTDVDLDASFNQDTKRRSYEFQVKREIWPAPQCEDPKASKVEIEKRREKATTQPEKLQLS